jgi:hypothetical protein
VKDALIPDLTPGDQADLGSDVVSRVSHGSRRVTRGESLAFKELGFGLFCFFRTRF